MQWDPAQYGRFANERNRAFLDLTTRIGATAPRHVVDVGCGPGYLTGLLAKRWPEATIEGIDSSPEMIAAAAEVAGASFSVGDAAAWQPSADVDVVVSNAALQWVPHHHELMARWAAALPDGSWLAVQVPGNFDAPGYALLRSLTNSARWARELHNSVDHTNWAGSVDSYADVLLTAGMVADVWETTYRHILAGEDPVLEWMRGTALRPLLAALSPSDADKFTAELKAELRQAYPPGPYGTLFDFRRVFAVGHKP